MKKVYIWMFSSWNKQMRTKCSAFNKSSLWEFELYVYQRYGSYPRPVFKLDCITLIMEDKDALLFTLHWNDSVRKVEPFINEDEKPLIYKCRPLKNEKSLHMEGQCLVQRNARAVFRQSNCRI